MAEMSQIQEFVDRIVERFDPLKVILFGSYAYGEPTEDSDVDLLVVMPDDGDPLGKSMEVSSEVPHYGFALDLIVRDPATLEHRIKNQDWFLKDIVEQGRVIYEREHAGVALQG